MGRRSKKNAPQGGTPAWLITFSDMMTLLLTFFVLLLSMASLMDERKKHLALGSITQTFGMGAQTMSILGQKLSETLLEPGPLSEEDAPNLAQLKPLLFEENRKDIEFISNAFVQILSVHATVLFDDNQSRLSREGRAFLTRALPFFQDLTYPLLLAGHASPLADGGDPESAEGGRAVDHSWSLSLQRALAVYTFLLDQGMDPQKLRLEAFGQYHPRFSPQTRSGRKRNRRVDFIVDKRNYVNHNPNKLTEINPELKLRDRTFKYRDFTFSLEEEQPPSR